MPLILYVVNPFGGYQRGAMISNPSLVATILDGDDALNVVQVSDGPVVVPDAPPPLSGVSLSELISAYNALSASNASVLQALQTANQIDTNQSAVLALQAQQLATLAAAISDLEARIENPNGGAPIPVSLADDVPLTEVDGVVLATNSGAILVGDLRE